MPKQLDYPPEVYKTMLAYLVGIEHRKPSTVHTLLGIGKDKARELLAAAYEEGYLSVSLNPPIPAPDRLTAEIVLSYREYGLRKVLVMPAWPEPAWRRKKTKEDRQVGIPTQLSYDLQGLGYRYDDMLRRSLCQLAALPINTLLRQLDDNEHVAVGGGRTMLRLAEYLQLGSSRIVLRPLATGGRWGPVTHFDAETVLQVILQKNFEELNRDRGLIRVMCPEAPPGQIDQVSKNPEVQAVFGKDAKRPAVTICSLGHVEYHPSKYGPEPSASTFVRLLAESRAYEEATATNVFEPVKLSHYRRAYRNLIAAGVVGDICRYGIREDGTVASIPGFPEKSALAVHPSRLNEWRNKGSTTIVIATGRRLARPLRAALLGGYFSHAIMDMGLATELVRITGLERARQARERVLRS